MPSYRFIGYRPHAPEEYYAKGIANPPDQPQYEGIVFGDGSVACRWFTEHRSTSVWDCWADFEKVHGHPEYGTVLEWPDGVPANIVAEYPDGVPGGSSDGEAHVHDPVHHPAHYTSNPSGVECIQVAEWMPFNVGNAMKYLWRADHKGFPIEDLRKAAWYVEREIERLQ